MLSLDFKPNKNEEILKILKTHSKTLFPYFILFIALFAVQFLIFKFFPSEGAVGYIKTSLSIILALAQIIYVIYPFLKWKSTYYVITTKRVMIKKGIFTRNIEELPCNYMGRIKIERGILDMIFGSGTIRIFNPSDVHAGLKFDDVPKVKEVRALLDKLSNFGNGSKNIDVDSNEESISKEDTKSKNSNTKGKTNNKAEEHSSISKIEKLSSTSLPGFYEIYLENNSSYEIEIPEYEKLPIMLSLNKNIDERESLNSKKLKVVNLDLHVGSSASFKIEENNKEKDFETGSSIIKILKLPH